MSKTKNQKLKVLALIPARSGSRSIRNKNIRMLAGRPLLAYSIEAALSSKLIDRVIVSTDSRVYAKIANRYGAEVPFLRPAKISRQTSTDLEVFLHALSWLKRNEGYLPDICVHLRPTSPIRNVEDIDGIIKVLIDRPALDSVRSITASSLTPMKMWFRNKDGMLTPAVKTNIKDAYNLPRQILPRVFIQNAAVDAVRSRVITENRSMTGSKIYGYLMDEFYDIDTEEDFKRAESALRKRRL